jgi:type I restriction enzyme, R subunit
MAAQTTERAFETYVEEILLTTGGWRSGSNAEWDKERALFPARVCAFLQVTQSKVWEEMKGLHASGLEALLINTLVKELDTKGSLHVLRHGFKFYGKTFYLGYFKPAHGANSEVLELFAKNRLTVTRQVPSHPNDNRTLDVVLAVNGLPVATIE